MNQIETQMEQIAHATQTLSEFVQEYGPKIPDGLGHISCNPSPRFDVDLDFASSDDRERALSILGEIFGRHGWTSKQAAYKLNHRNWTKTVEGVDIKIDGAEQFPEAAERPVQPTEFPIALNDVA